MTRFKQLAPLLHTKLGERVVRQFLTIGSLRLVTGATQFAVIIFLATILSLDELGQYSLAVIYLTYAIQLTGLNLHTYALRDQATVSRDKWPALLQQQWIFLAISTTAVVALISMLQCSQVLQLPTLPYFSALLFLGALNTQNENFLVGASRPISSAISLLLRASWIYAVILLNLGLSRPMTLQAILSMWTCAEILGLLFSLTLLARARLLPTRWYGINKNWLLKGLRVGTHYTVLGLLLIVSFSVQRVALGHLLDGQAVGIFHFFFVISVFGPNLLEASLFAIYLPRLIANSASRNLPSLQLPSRLSLALLAGGGAIGLAVLYAILPVFTRILGKPELLEYSSLFAFTATYALLYTVARAFHYSLYAAQADRWLLKVNAMVCFIACTTSFVFVSYFGLQGAGWSLLLSGFSLLAGNCVPFFNTSVRESVIGKNTHSPK